MTPVLRRTSLTLLSGVTASAVLLGVAPTASAANAPADTSGQSVVRAADSGQEMTAEQREFIEAGLGEEALTEIELAMQEQAARDGVQTRAFPIAAAAVAAAAWCARGAVASIPTSVLSDVADGKFSGKGTYARNAIIGCLGGEIGGWAWKVLPGWVKNKAVAMVAAFIIKYIR